MTDSTVTIGCRIFQGLTVPEAWVAPTIPTQMVLKVREKLALGDGKEAKAGLAKYLMACAVALDLDTTDITKEGKPVKEGDLFLALVQAVVEAEAAAAARKAEAEAAAAVLRVKMERIAKLEGDMRAFVVATPEALTWTILKGWANLAREAEASVVIHGGAETEGAGIHLRFKGASGTSGAPRAPRETGGGSKGGAETRVSAYAEALRFQKKGGAPHNISRIGDGETVPYKFLDHGKPISGPLSKYMQEAYPTCPCSESLRGYDERRKAAKGASV